MRARGSTVAHGALVESLEVVTKMATALLCSRENKEPGGETAATPDSTH
jgi:hypothetical protein